MRDLPINQENLLAEQKELGEFLADPSAYSSSDFGDKSKRFSEVNDLVEKLNARNTLVEQLTQARELASSSDDELGQMAKQEVEVIESKLEALESDLLAELIPKDPNDGKNAIIEIRAGAGGDEASLFASELYRMYLRYCETHSLKTELISESLNDSGGYKEVIFDIKGDKPYGSLKFESGVHRVQRVPATESQGRIHTSTVTVAVLPEAEEKDIDIKPNDLKIDVYRAGGHGGQSVNTTDSAVRITYLPTGMVVTNQDEKSQIKNKEKAMSVLRSRLLQAKIDEEQSKLAAERKSLIGSGDRSEKIRTYNFPQDRITDHRINYSRSDIGGALSGSIEGLIENLQIYERQLATKNANN
jgi:peptide chain release factor 1